MWRGMLHPLRRVVLVGVLQARPLPQRFAAWRAKSSFVSRDVQAGPHRRADPGDHVGRAERAQKRPLYAVLVDAENASWRTLAPILEEIARFGDTTVRRVYGDFTMPELKEWRQVSLELSFRCVTTIRHIPGKGSSDASLMIEAMDALHLNSTLDGFVLVSSDSDFTSLAQRLREAGKHVIGFGQRKTPLPFVMACQRFIYTENLAPIYTESLRSTPNLILSTLTLDPRPSTINPQPSTLNPQCGRGSGRERGRAQTGTASCRCHHAADQVSTLNTKH